MRLTLEERGAYNTLLDMIYDRGQPIPDDPRWIAGWMGCSLRRWSIIRAKLISDGKIYEITVNAVPCLMNERAAKEIENQSKLSRKLSESGAKGGRKRAEKNTDDNKNSDLVEAEALQRPKLKTKTETEGTSEANASSATKGKRLSENWAPDEIEIAMARKRGLNDAEIEIEADKFRNYWCSRSGATAAKRNWPRTWDNWCIEAAGRRGRGAGVASAPRQPGGDRQGSGAFVDIIARRRGFI